MTADPYLEPAAGVLINRLGIANPQQVEADLTTAALADFGTRLLPGKTGWPVDWSALDPAENEAASIASLRGKTARLRAMLEALVTH